MVTSENREPGEFACATAGGGVVLCAVESAFHAGNEVAASLNRRYTFDLRDQRRGQPALLLALKPALEHEARKFTMDDGADLVTMLLHSSAHEFFSFPM